VRSADTRFQLLVEAPAFVLARRPARPSARRSPAWWGERGVREADIAEMVGQPGSGGISLQATAGGLRTMNGSPTWWLRRHPLHQCAVSTLRSILGDNASSATKDDSAVSCDRSRQISASIRASPECRGRWRRRGRAGARMTARSPGDVASRVKADPSTARLTHIGRNAAQHALEVRQRGRPAPGRSRRSSRFARSYPHADPVRFLITRLPVSPAERFEVAQHDDGVGPE